jgi:glyceraldehyde-3-phosphate dehydrogenase (NAD(P))
MTKEEALSLADVVVDCTPKGIGLKNKQQYYESLNNTVRGFIAQGSESGFGKPFAYNINHETLTQEDKFVQVVSCNTHNIAALVNALRVGTKTEGDFVCIRRASDVSQDDDYVAGLSVDAHKSEVNGTHHAIDASRIFSSMGIKDISLYSSSCVIPSQYMHAIRFRIKTSLPINKEDVVRYFEQSKFIALTKKETTNSVFSFGRDFGTYGRILNQTVVVEPTISVMQGDRESTVTGFCFTPQDGNSLMSSVAATLWFLNYKDWSATKEKLSLLDKYLFSNI